MTAYRTHLTIVDESALLYSSLPAFRVPQLDSDSGSVHQWNVVTYQQFHLDIEHFAKYWATTLAARGIPPRSVVGVWLVLIMPLLRSLLLIIGWCSQVGRNDVY